MGVRVYYYIVVAVLGFAVLLPQHGRQKKTYITLMAILHTFVCGWRYMYLTGDLLKYSGQYTRIYPNMSGSVSRCLMGDETLALHGCQNCYS